VVDEAIDGGRGGHRVLEDAVPLAEHEVAGDDERAAFVALGHEGEQDLGLVGRLLDVAQIVEDDDLVRIEATKRPGQVEVTAGGQELLDELVGREEQDADTGGDERVAERACQVALADARPPEQQDVVGALDEVATGELAGLEEDLAGYAGDVEGVEGLRRREPGAAPQPVDAALTAGLGLDLEHFGRSAGGLPQVTNAGSEASLPMAGAFCRRRKGIMSVVSQPIEHTVLAVEPANLSRVLVGYFQAGDIELYMQTTQIDASAVDRAKFATDYATACDHVNSIRQRREPEVVPLDDHTHLKALQTEPTFQEFGSPGGPIQLVKIDVGKLVVAQPRVDWSHVEKLIAQAPEPGDELALLQFCLPLQQNAPVVQVQTNFSPGTQTLSFIADNADFRICGPVIEPVGNGRAALGFMIGPGLQQMSVVSFSGRYVINNGYHRAVALAARGHVEVPVLLVHGTQLAHTPAARPGMFQPSLVFGDTPPRVEDFLSPAAVDLPRRRTRTLYSVHAAAYPIVD